MFQRLLQAEKQLLLWIQNHMRRTWLTLLMKGITFLGNGGLVWLLTAVCLLLWPDSRFSGAALLLALLLSAVCVNLLLKNLVGRARPHNRIDTLHLLVPHPRDFSFPSGHTASSFAAAAALLCTAPHWLGISALTAAALIAFSRLYLGAHFPSDVLCGAAVGSLLGVAAICLLRSLLQLPWLPDAVRAWLSMA